MPLLPSPEYADWWYDLSWKGIIGFGALAAFATAATVVFTVIQFWSDGVRDARSEDRSHVMELQLGDANRGAAEATARALEAQLALEKYKARRMLSAEQTARIVAKLPQPFPELLVLIGVNPPTSEALNFADQIIGMLQAAHFETHVVGGSFIAFGVEIRHAYGNEEGIKMAEALASALVDEGIVATALPNERTKSSFEKDPEGMKSSGHRRIVLTVGERPTQ